MRLDGERTGHRHVNARFRIASSIMAGILLLVGCRFALADSNTAVLDRLATADVYISDQAYGQHGVKSGDLARLQAAVDAAAARNVTEKIAIVAHVPSNIRSPQQAADSIRTYEDVSGVVVIVYPAGLGVSSDTLTVAQDTAIVARVRSLCATVSYTSCAIAAATRAVTLVRADEDNAFHDALVTWGIILAALAIVTGAAVLLYQWRSRKLLARYDSLPSLTAELEAARRTGPPPEASDSRG